MAAPSKIYSEIEDVIAPVGKRDFGFPADIVAEAFGLMPPKRTPSLRPFRFTKLQLTQELQSVKQRGPVQGVLPSLIATVVLGNQTQVLPAEYVRSLFLTQLFPERVRIVSSGSSQAKLLTSPFYITLDRKYVTEAKDSLSNLAALKAKNDQPIFIPSRPAEFARSARKPPHLVMAAIHSNLPEEGDANTEQTKPAVQGKIEDWFPRLDVGAFRVSMEAAGHSWHCGDWKEIASGPLDPLPRDLKGVDSQSGCVLNLTIDMPRGTDGVYKYITIVGLLNDPFACSPVEFGDKPAEGLTAPRCTNGIVRWGLEKNLISRLDRPPSFQLAIPNWKLATPPKIVLGLAGEWNVNFISRRDKSCWCSPNNCAPPEKSRCEEELGR